MTDHAMRIVSYSLAGLVLIGLAKIAPGPAVGIAVVLTLGVVLAQNQQVVDLLNVASQAIAGPQDRQK